MAMNVKILRDSFSLVVNRNPDLTTRFYEILFERAPQLQPLFSEEARSHQPAKLAAALGAVVDHLEDPEWLERTLGQMGQRHVGYGVTRDMYGPVGDALLVAMSEAAGDAWTEEIASQWSQAYGAIVDLMSPPRPT